MDWRWLLFSFHGRVNRAKYWLSVLIYLIAFVLLGVIVRVLHFAIGANAILQILAGIVQIAFLVSSLAVATKRLHDRDRSAWWLVVLYVLPPVIVGIDAGIAFGSGAVTQGRLTGTALAALIITWVIAMAIGIWGFVEIGCLRGTVGYNRYGPDPLRSSPPPTPSARRVAGR
jgi:uncharacterized membrane protein YhaH (DUF805 family)